MAITDLRYAASLLKSGFSASEVRAIIGLSAAQQPEQTAPPDDPQQETENAPDPEPEQEPENTPDPEPEPEPENTPDPEPEPEPEKQDPRTRRENPKTETLTDALAKLL